MSTEELPISTEIPDPDISIEDLEQNPDQNHVDRGDDSSLSMVLPDLVSESSAESLTELPDRFPPAQLDAPVDITQDLLAQTIEPNIPEVRQVRFKTIAGKLTLILPSDREIKQDTGLFYAELNWSDLLEQLEQRLLAGERFWQPRTLVYLQSGDRLLDPRQFQEIEDALLARELVLHSVATFRRQTAINAATAGYSIEQGTVSNELASPDRALDDPLYVKMTVRSGVEIRHPGSIVIFGDVNAGGEVIADGDILVWGKLKGKAHAGAKGNAQATIMALHLEATQLRIGDFIARVEAPATMYCPEVAHVSTSGSPSICIIRASDYSSLKP